MVRPCNFHPCSDHKLHNGTWDACCFVKIPMVHLPQHWSSCITCFPTIPQENSLLTRGLMGMYSKENTKSSKADRGFKCYLGSSTVNFEIAIWAHFLILPDHGSCGNEQSLCLPSTRQT